MTQITLDAEQTSRNLIAANDTGIFSVASETSKNDRTSLLMLQNLVAAQNNSYVYYEVGSHLGGTLVPHLLDQRCKSIVSIDPRPQQMPDERGKLIEYKGNSTKRMMQTLQEKLPSETLKKLTTFDSDAANVAHKDLPTVADLVFIDGEHTNAAAFSDFLSLFPMFAPDSIIAFHDANLTCDATLNVESFLRYAGVPHEIIFLPDCVGVVAIGSFAKTAGTTLASVKLDRTTFDRNARQGLVNQMIRRSISEGAIPFRTVRKAIWRRVKRAILGHSA